MRLKRADSRLLLWLEAAAALWAVRLALWIAPAAITRRVLAFPPAEQGRIGDAPARVAWAVCAAARVTPRSTCLVKAIAAWLMLRRRGVPAEVRIGARRGGSGIEAHAWLRCGDRELFTGAGDEYAVLR